MISVEKAHRQIEEWQPKPAKEEVEWDQAADRIVAEDILATFGLPRFTNSAMDGFALRWAETVGASRQQPVTLSLNGVIAAGESSALLLQPGDCAQIMTGAPLPEGADSVVMVEQTNGFGADPVQIFQPAKLGQNVRQAGEEVAENDKLLSAGTRLGPGEMGTLLGFGMARIPVYKKPVVALLVTGSELQPVGTDLQPGQIYNTNLPVLADILQRVGCEQTEGQSLPDDPQQIADQLAVSLGNAHIVVTSGGVSMGRFDLLRPALLDLGVREIFWKVAQKPGSPLFFGVRDKTLIFGLPGNPVSAIIVFMEYVWPVIQKMQGITPPPKLRAVLSETFPRLAQKHRFLFGRAWIEGHRLMVQPTQKHGSHMFTSALQANCILDASPGAGSLPRGREVRINPLPWASLAGPHPQLFHTGAA